MAAIVAAAALTCLAAIGQPVAAHAGDPIVHPDFDCTPAAGLPSVTRQQALTRGQSWVDVNVPYSESACHQNQYGNYREDCSGFVSMAWGLNSSYTTLSLPSVSHEISRSSLQTGDILLKPGEHTEMFVRWTDSAHTHADLMGETYDPQGTVLDGNQLLTSGYWSDSNGFHAYRYDNLDTSGGGGSSDGFGVAYRAPGGALWTAGSDGISNTEMGVRSGTSPSVTAVPGGYEMAFQSPQGSLWTAGDAGYKDRKLGMRASTSPAITAVDGGFEVAFQADDGTLWTTGDAGTKHWNLWMRAGTSPAIARLGSSYVVAYQAPNGDLWTARPSGVKHWSVGLRKGTSPAVTAVSGGFEVAFQSPQGSLWTVGDAAYKNWKLGMRASTSPAITAVDGGFEVAFQANDGTMWTTGHVTKHWDLWAKDGTSPAITDLSGGYEMAYQAPNGMLWTAGEAGIKHWNLYLSGSPAIDS